MRPDAQVGKTNKTNQQLDLTFKQLPPSFGILERDADDNNNDAKGCSTKVTSSNVSRRTSLQEELISLKTPKMSRKNSEAALNGELQLSFSNDSTITSSMGSASNNVFRIKSKTNNQVKLIKFNRIKAITPIHFGDASNISDRRASKLTLSTPKRKPTALQDYFLGSTPISPISTIETPEKKPERKSVQTQATVLGKLCLDRVDPTTPTIKASLSLRALPRPHSIHPPVHNDLEIERAIHSSCRHVIPSQRKFIFNGESPQEPSKPQLKAIKVERRGSSSSSRKPVRVFSLPSPTRPEEMVQLTKLEPRSYHSQPGPLKTGEFPQVEKGRYITMIIGEMIDSTSPVTRPTEKEMAQLPNLRAFRSNPEHSSSKKNLMKFRNQENILNKLFKE